MVVLRGGTGGSTLTRLTLVSMASPRVRNSRQNSSSRRDPRQRSPSCQPTPSRKPSGAFRSALDDRSAHLSVGFAALVANEYLQEKRMSGPIVYVDRSQVVPGRLDELRQQIADLADLIEGREPQLLMYEVYFDDRWSEMTVVHVHRNQASLDAHFGVVGPALERFTGLVELKSIDVYGQPSDDVMVRVRAKAALLGEGSVTVHRHFAGFIRAGGAST